MYCLALYVCTSLSVCICVCIEQNKGDQFIDNDPLQDRSTVTLARTSPSLPGNKSSRIWQVRVLARAGATRADDYFQLSPRMRAPWRHFIRHFRQCQRVPRWYQRPRISEGETLADSERLAWSSIHCVSRTASACVAPCTCCCDCWYPMTTRDSVEHALLELLHFLMQVFEWGTCNVINRPVTLIERFTNSTEGSKRRWISNNFDKKCYLGNNDAIFCQVQDEAVFLKGEPNICAGVTF